MKTFILIGCEGKFKVSEKECNIFLNNDGIAKLGDLKVSKVAKAGLLSTQQELLIMQALKSGKTSLIIDRLHSTLSHHSSC
ncbi:unnamed protein product [Moneuplotes crassus]|uniref:Uncharacterized protein n=1 Tax=Euplotes crassus TaxID=5936 RepID=A0AAD1U4E6_EUPCR|nr:unnamed protein product [Moneuplotes crassus]